MENRKQQIEQRMNFYAKSGLLGKDGFLTDYFKLEKGVRCVAGHHYDYPDRSPQYYEYDNQGSLRMITLPDCDGKWNYLCDWNTTHAFMFAFDKRVLDWMPLRGGEYAEIIEDSIVGINAVFEIDTPYEGEWEGAKRLDFFDYIQDFNNIISHVDKVCEDVGEEYNVIFSRNGIYITLGGVYIDVNVDEEEFNNYVENFEKLFMGLKVDDGYGDKLAVHIDNSSVPWNDYMKIPFTGSDSGRWSLPLGGSGGGYGGCIIDDVEWLKSVCYEKDLMVGGKMVVSEIIRRAVKNGWRKIW